MAAVECLLLFYVCLIFMGKSLISWMFEYVEVDTTVCNNNQQINFKAVTNSEER